MSAPAPLSHAPSSTYDLVGVGFGPSNLALAIAVREHNEQAGHSALSDHYLERQASFGWHQGMLIDGPLMQVPFLKDLVTLRNPSSRFSFLSYLKSEDRLSAFINRTCWFPSRLEFNAYLTWAAAAFAGAVDYASEAIAVSPAWRAEQIVGFDIHVRRLADAQSETWSCRARNLVLALGSEPWMPSAAVPSKRVWHSDELAFRARRLVAGEPPARIVVVGAGQSAAETVEYLHRRLSRTEICVVFTDFGFRPLDDSPYVNRIFDPARVDTFFDAPRPVKREVMAEYRNAVYAGVDRELIQTLYARAYEEAVAGEGRLRVMDLSRIGRVCEGGEGVEVEIESRVTGESRRLAADVLVYATGYRPIDTLSLLGQCGRYCERDAHGRVRLERGYRVLTAPRLQAGIFVQGPSEHTHGPSSTVLSNIAGRAGEIVTTISRSPRRRYVPRRAGRTAPEPVL